MRTEDAGVAIAMEAARMREARDGTCWRESVGEAWLKAHERGVPVAVHVRLRVAEEISMEPPEDAIEMVDALVASEARPAETPEAGIVRSEVHRAMTGELLRLSARIERVIRLRFGLGHGGLEHTLGETGRTMNLSPARIADLEAFGLRRLRTPSARRNLLRVAPESVRYAMLDSRIEPRIETSTFYRGLPIRKPAARCSPISVRDAGEAGNVGMLPMAA